MSTSSPKEDLVRKCREDLLTSFSNYDQAVDIVSCWQTFLRSYGPDLTYFDRFPVMGSEKLTPDFAALFKGSYGLIGEIKRTFPKDPVAFRREMEQLVKYDQHLPFKVGQQGDPQMPERHDIVLVISADNSAEIANRINDIMSRGEFLFNNSLVIMEYFYNSGDRVSRYTIRKYQGRNRPFRDEALPPNRRLETILGVQHKAIQVTVSMFMPDKIREVLCNDAPPPLYLTAHLWTKIFYDYLSDEQKMVWKKKNPRTILLIVIDPRDLTGRLNRDYLPNVRILESWVKDSLDFLVAAGLAKPLDNDQYEVGFSNRTTKFGARTFGAPEERDYDIDRECAGMLANEYCKWRVGAGAEKAPARPKVEPGGKYVVPPLSKFMRPQDKD